jgi:putative peptidoglycan lipid II flippase
MAVTSATIEARRGQMFPILTATELARLMLPYLVLAGPLAVMMGVLNANGRFGTAAFATTAFNATMLAALGVVFLLQAGDSQLSG